MQVQDVNTMKLKKNHPKWNSACDLLAPTVLAVSKLTKYLFSSFHFSSKYIIINSKKVRYFIFHVLLNVQCFGLCIVSIFLKIELDHVARRRSPRRHPPRNTMHHGSMHINVRLPAPHRSTIAQLYHVSTKCTAPTRILSNSH